MIARMTTATSVRNPIIITRFLSQPDAGTDGPQYKFPNVRLPGKPKHSLGG